MENVDSERSIIKHEWLQVGAMIITVAGLFIWNHSEMHSFQRDTQAQISAIHQEIKDFHGRLCAIEERNKK